jgi:hypothetical protein
VVANKRPVVVASQLWPLEHTFVFVLLLRRRLRLPLLPSVIAIVVAERSISLLFAPDSTAAELLNVISVFLVQFGGFFFFLMCDMVHSDVQLLFFFFFGEKICVFCSFRELHGTN